MQTMAGRVPLPRHSIAVMPHFGNIGLAQRSDYVGQQLRRSSSFSRFLAFNYRQRPMSSPLDLFAWSFGPSAALTTSTRGSVGFMAKFPAPLSSQSILVPTFHCWQPKPVFSIRNERFKSCLKTNKSASKRFRVRGNGSLKRYVVVFLHLGRIIRFRIDLTFALGGSPIFFRVLEAKQGTHTIPGTRPENDAIDWASPLRFRKRRWNRK
jgi:hypothetical protein